MEEKLMTNGRKSRYLTGKSFFQKITEKVETKGQIPYLSEISGCEMGQTFVAYLETGRKMSIIESFCQHTR